MFLALTGTPGTGKTSIARLLKKKGVTIIFLKEIAETYGFIDSYDEKRNSNILDVDAINQYIRLNHSDDEHIVIEGLLSHFLSPIQFVVVLRCHPRQLRKRLIKRNWNWEKIRENIEAEIVDIILCEAIQKHSIDRVREIDTSTVNPKKTAEQIYQLLQGKKNECGLKPGIIDWSESLFDQTILKENTHGS